MPRALLINHSILFLCTSTYLGAGVFLVFFLLPLEPQLDISNYKVVLVDPIDYATRFFTWVTILIVITSLIMLVTEWVSGLKWPSIVVLLGVGIATTITHQFHFPLNEELAAGITSNDRLADVLDEWADYSRLRFLFWAVQWFAVMYYFYSLAYRSREDQ
ncbi:MAG: hypothetical protein OXG25_01670 [Gammaproteobacteria bacterium]|nr:hypothetical protein [Gammaproteobacteria bacterium]